MKKNIYRILLVIILSIVPFIRIGAVDYDYYFDADYIKGITLNTKVEDFRNNLENKFLNSSNYQLNCNGNLYVGTGCKLDYNNKIYTTIVHGDLNGDGKSTMTDVVSMVRFSNNKMNLDQQSIVAGDINNNGKIDDLDIKLNSLYVVKGVEFVPSSEQDTVEVESIRLDENLIELNKNHGYKLNYQVLPENATNKLVTFESSNPDIVTVDESGYIFAKSNGTATITVKHINSDNKVISTSVEINVVVPVLNISLSKDNLDLDINETYRLEYLVNPEDAIIKNINYTSNDISIATVDENGVITAISDGTTVITVTINGVSAECKVSVVSHSSDKISFIDKPEFLYTGQSFKLNVLSDNLVTFESSDNNVATVNEEGLLTAIKPGKVNITAKDSQNNTATISVQIIDDSLILNVKGVQDINKGGTFQIVADRLSIENDNYNDFIYNSANSDILSVTQTGVVTGVSKGQTTITVTTKDGSLSKTVTFNVVVPVLGISLDCDTLDLTVGQTKKLTATINPADAEGTIIWTSSSSIATVTQTGLVTAKSEGQVRITASLSNGGSGEYKKECLINISEPKDPNLVEVKSITLNEFNSGKRDGLVVGNFTSDDNVSTQETSAMAHNTSYLQNLVNNAKEGQTIKLPAGVFYFSSNGKNSRKVEDFVIRFSGTNKGFSIVGAGIDETKSDGHTILKPYGDVDNGLDMFYFNAYMDYNDPIFLTDIDFSDFIIDSEYTHGRVYNSAGKGFMINLCKDCDWNNIIVRNTDGTGFGMDCTINCTITNCKAQNCGKAATTSSFGASGFGIGTGYSNDESMVIDGCISIGNKKFGYFFEHQNRFERNHYKAKKGNFVVKNSKAVGNLYNFGGERANDVTYENCSSEIDSKGYTMADIYFSEESRRTSILNFNPKIQFNDISSNTYYYDAVVWSYKKGILTGKTITEFGVGEAATRAQAILMLWRMANRPGEVIYWNEETKTGTMTLESSRVPYIETGFIDVPTDSTYASAVYWAKNKNILHGTTNSTFKPDENIKRIDFLMMLWRYWKNVSGGSGVNEPDYDGLVSWANKKGIIDGYTYDKDEELTREILVNMLYRYNNCLESNSSCLN